jgi:hypothetical protein
MPVAEVYGVDGRLDSSFLKNIQIVLHELADLGTELSENPDLEIQPTKTIGRVPATLNLCYHQVRQPPVSFFVFDTSQVSVADLNSASFWLQDLFSSVYCEISWRRGLNPLPGHQSQLVLCQSPSKHFSRRHTTRRKSRYSS